MSFMQPDMSPQPGGSAMKPPSPITPAQAPQGAKPKAKGRMPTFMGSIGTEPQSNPGGKQLMGQ